MTIQFKTPSDSHARTLPGLHRAVQLIGVSSINNIRLIDVNAHGRELTVHLGYGRLIFSGVSEGSQERIARMLHNASIYG